MITTDFDGSIFLITHRAEGTIALSDILRVMEQTASLHELYDAPVLWDLRNIFIEGAQLKEYESGIPDLVKMMKGQMAVQKRAFVVSQVEHKTFLEKILESAPWPWGVFTDFDDAIRWVGE